MAPVYIGHEDEGGGAFLLDAPTLQLAVPGDVELLATMGTDGFYFDPEALVT